MKSGKKSTAELRPRKCLMCGKPFPSQWAGERVCRRCKSTNAWREGRTFSSTPWTP